MAWCLAIKKKRKLNVCLTHTMQYCRIFAPENRPYFMGKVFG
jgi:hypothetical protein